MKSIIKRFENKEKLNEKLLVACYEANEDEVRKLLRKDADPNAKDKNGVSALHKAIIQKGISCVNILLDEGADVHATDNSGYSALHIAASNGNHESVHLVLNKGANINQQIDSGYLDAGNTALHLAAINGRKANVYILVNNRADLEIRNNKGETALHLAGNDRSIMEFLLDKGADIDARTLNGSTLLHKETIRSNLSNVKWLLDRGADSNIKTNYGQTALDIAKRERNSEIIELLSKALRAQQSLNESSTNSEIPTAENLQNISKRLLIACKKGDIANIREALNLGADPNTTNKKGVSLLHLLLKKGDFKAINLITSYKINLQVENQNGRTPLMIAASDSNLFGLLLKKGAKLDYRNKNGLTALHLAAAKGYIKTIELALQGKPNLEIRDNDGWTPLHIASGLGQTECVKLFLEYGANVASCNAQNHTPLHAAAEGGYYEISLLLLNHGADVLAKDNKQENALHKAVLAGQTSLVKALLLQGADTSAINVNGKTAEQLATKDEIIDLFLKRDQSKSAKELIPENRVEVTTRVEILPSYSIIPKQLVGLSATYLIPYSALSISKTDNQFIELGSGAFGTVYRGKWQYVDVAIKKLKLQSMTEKALKEFKRETKIMTKMTHPNVIRLYGACIEPNQYAMVMEYMPKGSLYSVLHGLNPPAWPVRWKIALDIGKGILHLHHKNILHRDLKSLNVLLDANYHAKVSDFGLSLIKTETQTATANQVKNQAAGTLLWMAPELFEGCKYTKACDIYSYGMILWELASCKNPYANFLSAFLIILHVQQGKRETIPAYTPPSFAKLIARCWAQRAEERPSIEEVLHELDEKQDEASIKQVA